jgi:hypothetical protein
MIFIERNLTRSCGCFGWLGTELQMDYPKNRICYAVDRQKMVKGVYHSKRFGETPVFTV